MAFTLLKYQLRARHYPSLASKGELLTQNTRKNGEPTSQHRASAMSWRYREKGDRAVPEVDVIGPVEDLEMTRRRMPPVTSVSIHGSVTW